MIETIINNIPIKLDRVQNHLSKAIEELQSTKESFEALLNNTIYLNDYRTAIQWIEDLRNDITTISNQTNTIRNVMINKVKIKSKI